MPPSLARRRRLPLPPRLLSPCCGWPRSTLLSSERGRPRRLPALARGVLHVRVRRWREGVRPSRSEGCRGPAWRERHTSEDLRSRRRYQVLRLFVLPCGLWRPRCSSQVVMLTCGAPCFVHCRRPACAAPVCGGRGCFGRGQWRPVVLVCEYGYQLLGRMRSTGRMSCVECADRPTACCAAARPASLGWAG